jgi:4-hydroxy-tetrahydrodipicolinate synthase
MLLCYQDLRISERGFVAAISNTGFGLSCALATPFLANGDIDQARLSWHARHCLGQGCGSVTVFGTTGEGASFGLGERVKTIAALKDAGIDARRAIIGGVASSSQPDAMAQIEILLDADCRQVLLTPPFYFKGVSDDGLFAWFAELFHKLGGRARDIILYNIPSVTAVALSVPLIGRLRAEFPELIRGVKDSSGDWAYTQQLLAAHSDLIILIGDERHLAHGVRLGAQGAISGLANIIAPRLLPLVREGRDDAEIVRLVDEVLKYPVIPAIKSLLAQKTNDEAWQFTRPPLLPLAASDAVSLTKACSALFTDKAA